MFSQKCCKSGVSAFIRLYATGSSGKQKLVFTWGSGWNGRLGHNNRSHTRSPKQLSYLDQFNVVKLHAKGKHILALTADGRVLAWGCNDAGQLGLGPKQKTLAGQYYDYHMPMNVEGLPPVVDVAAGYSTSAAIDADGNVWIWGDNSKGQLSKAVATSSSPTPTKIPGFGKEASLKAIKVSLGEEHSAVLDENGMLWTWGNDDYGRLGHGTRYSMRLGSKVTEPTMVAFFGPDEPGRNGQPLKVKHITCGQAHTIVTTETDQVFAFGKNNRQQLGCDTGAIVNRTQQFDCVDIPTAVPILADKVYCSNTYSLAIDKDGRALYWGGTNSSPTPIKRAGGKAFRNKIIDSSVGVNHIAMVTEKGRLFMLGRNTFGELGVTEPWYRKGNPLAGMRTEPVPLAELKDYNVLQVTCGNRCTAALVERRDAEGDEDDEPAEDAKKKAAPAAGDKPKEESPKK